MRLMIFMCFAMSIMYAVGNVYDMHFKDMLSHQTPYASTLHKDKETQSTIHYKGTITLSGVLEWQMYEEEVDFYWRLVFFPDTPDALPRLFADDKRAIFLNDTLKRDPTFQENSFLQIYNLLPNQLNQADEYILGGIAMRATLSLKDYYIDNQLESEAETPYYATIETDSVKISNNIKKWYINKNALPSEYLLFFASKDSYINLRQSPNGKILQAIQKDTMLNDCNTRGNELKNQGILLSLGVDSTNPKWLKVAYIPPEAKDTSKAIYGVIHESQVRIDCYEN
ncbi:MULTISPECIES: hypothetical protein [Helicobacter]|uniref:hypothetical protein n=1 Tax=Helicobacter TaxID=209 RepID=UPI0025DFDB51|nr:MULTISPECIES: hypothetical protein [Helicobacter]